ATAVPGDPDLALLALSGAGLWDAGFAPPFTAGPSVALSGSSGLSGSEHQSAEVPVGSPAATPTGFPGSSSPTTASTPDFAASLAGLRNYPKTVMKYLGDLVLHHIGPACRDGDTSTGRTPTGSDPGSSHPSCRSAPRSPGTCTARPASAPPPTAAACDLLSVLASSSLSVP